MNFIGKKLRQRLLLILLSSHGPYKINIDTDLQVPKIKSLILVYNITGLLNFDNSKA